MRSEPLDSRHWPLGPILVDEVGFEPTKALGRQIYSLLPLTAWVPLRENEPRILISRSAGVNAFLARKLQSAPDAPSRPPPGGA